MGQSGEKWFVIVSMMRFFHFIFFAVWLAASCSIADRFGSRSPFIFISLTFFAHNRISVHSVCPHANSLWCLWVRWRWREFIRRCSDFLHILPPFVFSHFFFCFFFCYLFAPFAFCLASIESLEWPDVQCYWKANTSHSFWITSRRRFDNKGKNDG